MKATIANLDDRIAAACAGFDHDDIAHALILALSKAIVATRPDVPEHARDDLARLVSLSFQTGLTGAANTLDAFRGADAKQLYFGPKNDAG